LGGGPGGYIAAIRAARLGARVTVVENDNLGGTCLNWGCIPTKALQATARAIETTRRLETFGVKWSGRIQPEMDAIMVRKQKVVDTLVTGIAKAFDKNGIRLVRGRGRVLDVGRVRVDCEDGSSVDIEGERLILATGSRPLDFPAFPFDGTRILSSNDALTLQDIPGEILIIGGGVIGSEFAFILNEFGSRVTVVEALDRVVGLPSVDVDVSKTLGREFKKKKIKLYLNRTVVRAEATTDNRVQVTLGPSPFLKPATEKDKKEIELVVDKVLVTIGRQPNTEDLGLETIGLAPDSRGWLTANDRMETDVPGVYAIGDVLGPAKIMLAHVASTEGLVAAENCVGGHRIMRYNAVPSAIFTFPEIADVGLTEAQAGDLGLACRADTFLFRDLGKSQALGEIAGQVKIVSEIGTGKILGTHIIGPHAADLIAEATLAVQLGATVKDLAATIHAHPSLSEAVAETAHAALGFPLHGG